MLRSPIQQRLVAAVLLATLPGCMVHLPSPAPPARVEPAVEEPAYPAPQGHTRVVLDAEGGPVKVSRVTATLNHVGVYGPPTVEEGVPLGSMRAEEPLCVTPCVVDVRQGLHTFVFADTRSGDPSRVTTADVVVSSKPIVVRHAVGQTPRYTSSYVSGAALFLIGSGLTLMGGVATTIGAVGEWKPTEPDEASPQAVLSLGLVMLGIGLVTGTAGTLMMYGNRPVDQPGSTTQWTR
ncbi:MAG: hypothetical protein KF819_27915 [Labilithrix sp.]|nr:hypothetical protein [Labilithrix sp.]